MVADAAYARCLYIARQHYENFPVASRLLPKSARPHIAAVYAFARIADDFADEGLHDAVAGTPATDNSDASGIFVALADTMRRFQLEPQWFEDLLSAFRQDVLTNRYETWEDLLDYCRRSANPVGRLVLRIAGYRDARLDEWSDAVCTGLQLVNFWQDLEQDWRKGRLYVPLDLVRRAGADLEDLRRHRFTPAWRSALADAGARKRVCFDRGRPIADAVRGRLRWELRATWLGGVRILDRLEATGYNVFRARPVLAWTDFVAIGARSLVWRAGSHGGGSVGS